MKYAKMLGLAAIAALALMAVVGAGTAAAKVCSASGAGSACGGSHGNEYTGTVHATSSNATLTSSFVTVTCSSTINGNISNSSAGTGTISALTFSGCTSAQASNCSATSTASGSNQWHAVAAATTAPNGTMEVSNVGGQFTCTVFGIKTTCIYADATVGDAGEIVVTGGSTATVKATKVSLARQAGSGFGCSETGTWSGDYTIGTPDSLYLT